jgi:hypothetical protein
VKNFPSIAIGRNAAVTFTRCRVLAAATLGALPVLAPTAHAGGVVAYAEVWTQWTGSDALVCAEGAADPPSVITGEWIFTVNGARSDGAVIAPEPQIVDGPFLHVTCVPVSDGGTAYGSITAHVDFVRAGTSTVLGLSALVTAWDPAFPRAEVSWGTGG